PDMQLHVGVGHPGMVRPAMVPLSRSELPQEPGTPQPPGHCHGITAEPIMSNEPIPDDLFRPPLSDDEFRRQVPLDNELQPDPELAEGPASGAKVAMFAVAIAVVLGAVFYG